MTESANISDGSWLAQRAIIRLSPLEQSEDVSDFLQGLVSQDMSMLEKKQILWSALLSAQGKLMFDFLLWHSGKDVLIDCEVSAVDSLIRRLSLYRLRRKISIARDDSLAVHWSAQEKSDALQDPRLTALGWRWLEPHKQNTIAADAIWLKHRLSLGVAEGETDFGSEKILWLECNAEELNGVSYTKGCFIGQENTARMHYRNKVNRRIAIIPAGLAQEKRIRHNYSGHGLDVVHAPVTDMAEWPLPDWQKTAIAEEQ